MSVGADKAYDTRDFVTTVREMNIRPHLAQNLKRRGGSALDARTTRHATYQVSQQKRPLIEKVFGWMKQTGGMRKTKQRGLFKVSWQFLMTAAAFNLWRLPKLEAAKGVVSPNAANGVFNTSDRATSPTHLPSYSYNSCVVSRSWTLSSAFFQKFL